MKTGRRTGEEAVIFKVVSDTICLIRLKSGKERKASVNHLEPTDRME